MRESLRETDQSDVSHRAPQAVAGSSARGARASAFPWGDQLPLVGRRADLSALRLILDAAIDGAGQTVFVAGDGGVGKTRLLEVLSADARGRDAVVAIGRAFAVETSHPYGLLADALMPVLRSMDESALAVLTRGVEGDLRAIIPGLPSSRGMVTTEPVRDPDLKSRLFWNFAQFLSRLTQRHPMLLVLENAHWCDASSIELLHFLARQIATARLMLTVTYATDDRDASAAIRGVERSLVSRDVAVVRQIEPLTRLDVSELLQRVFGVTREDADRASAPLHVRTLGNPFFLQEILKALLASGRLRSLNGKWSGFELEDDILPVTVRDAVEGRLQGLSEAARQVADWTAIVGTRVPIALLEHLTERGSLALADALDELCERHVLEESEGITSPEYDYAHPIVRTTVLTGLSGARQRVLHARVAHELERLYGENADAHASEIAGHLVRGQGAGDDVRALRFLATAGRDALARRADREAVRWLGEALSIADRSGESPDVRRAILEDLALARQRAGDLVECEALWRRALALAEETHDDVAQSRILRRLGLAAALAARSEDALDLLGRAEEAARRGDRNDLAVRIRVAQGMMLQSLGRSDAGKQLVTEALTMAESIGDQALLARVHRALLLLYTWTGPSDVAYSHGRTALAMSETSGDREVAWSAHWAMSVLEGFSGNAEGVVSHRHEAERLANELRSPLLQALTGEIAVEYASVVGDWREGLAIAERLIPVARAIASHTLLPRLLVWTGIIVLARDDLPRAKSLFDEAWRLARVPEEWREGAPEGLPPGDVNNAIVAITGMACYHLALGEWARARALGLRALAIGDRDGAVAWAIHRILPVVAEASLWLQDFDAAERVSERLRRESTPLGHRLGLAWAETIEALVLRLKHQAPEASERLLKAAAALEGVPFTFQAARLRRNAAQVLEADGDIEGAVRELRRAHDVFARLGAEFELRGTRSHLRSLGVRLPPRTSPAGAGALTGRELEIARLVARRLTNKEIGRDLDISSRTVSTHLSNIFEKIGVDSRGALVDALRANPAIGEGL